MAMLVVRAGLRNSLEYRFTQAVFDNLPQLHVAHPAARNLTLHTALTGMPRARAPAHAVAPTSSVG
jgi:TRAP-type uncharacterized transport system substrate-binding protein